MDVDQISPLAPFMRARVALRARSLLDVLDLAVRFCAVHAGVYAILSAIVILPALVASWAIAGRLGWPAGWAVAVVLTPFVDAPFVLLASRLVFQEHVRGGETLALAAKSLPRLATVRLLQTLALATGLVTVGLSLIYAVPITLFASEVVLVEHAEVVAAFARSRRLAAAHFGIALGAAAVLFLVRGGAALLADVGGRELLETVLQVRPPPPAWKVGGSVLALAGWWTTVPFLATARFFVYLDLRTRSEGWDIQTRFAAIAVRARQLAQPRGPGP